MSEPVYCLACGRDFDADQIPYPLRNGICEKCRRELRRPTHQLRAEINQAVFLFGALGHSGEHENCDPCEYVKRNAR